MEHCLRNEATACTTRKGSNMPPPKQEPYAYVKSYYGVNPVIGQRVTTKDSKKSGVIVRKQSYDHYVHVKFDGSTFDVPCHPEELIYQ